MENGGPTSPLFRPRWKKVLLAVLLAWVAGFVDVMGYVTLIHIFTSHMSGNSVAMMANLARHEWSEALRRAFPIPAFVSGVFIGATLGTLAGRRRIRHRFFLPLGFEVALLFAFMICENWAAHAADAQSLPAGEFYPLTGLLAMAMGVQSATLRQVWGAPVHTTFITGVLTHFGENASLLLLDRHEPSMGPAGPHNYLRLMLLDGGVWLAFVLGAACGGFGRQLGGVLVLIAPLCVLVFIVCWDFIQPFHES